MKPDNKKTNTPPTNPSETDSETNWWVVGSILAIMLATVLWAVFF